MGPDVSKTFWKFGGLVARRNRYCVKKFGQVPKESRKEFLLPLSLRRL
jgi:hypothetical protein